MKGLGLGRHGQAVAAALLAMTLMGASCRKSGSDDAVTTTTSIPQQSTTSTTVIDVSVIPPNIDVAYVQRVLDVLDEINGGVLRDLLTKRQVTPDMSSRLRAIYNPQELDRQVQALNEQLTRDLSVFKDPPGNRRTVVRRLGTTSGDCVFVEALFDNSAVLKAPNPSPSPTYLALEPPQSSAAAANRSTALLISREDKDGRDACTAS